MKRSSYASQLKNLTPLNSLLNVWMGEKISAIDDPEAHQIKGNKKAFAEQIVPTLDKAEFEAFRAIFDKIEQLIQHLEID
ncbi:hypothetical protein QUF64_01165 [Anaerolineales bacterium HSG6]|nr:hypothetical protein [Anaerolineales bacterium HSG6]